MTDTARLTTALADRYVIERELGAGGMATVYLAKDLRHERGVALKVLRPELTSVLGVERFLQEVRITARLDHPHILTLLDSGESDGFLWYVLPYVRGESLRARLVREKQLGLEEALVITRQIAGALDYAHRQGVIHRDTKPENILLFEGEAMLADFGIALAVQQAGGQRLTESGLWVGTPQYMSPEQATGDRALDGRSDVYSLAAVLYEMLAGEPPHSGPTAQAIIAKLMTERPTRLRTLRDSVPEGIDNAVAKALAKVPADRFTNPEAFARTLMAGTPSAATRRIDRRLIYGLGMAGLVAIAALGIWIWKAQRRSVDTSGVLLRDRTQLTFTGRVRTAAISGDGKQLAYVTPSCRADGCTYTVEIQDVGGTAIRHVLEGATATGQLWWSPDRRYLMFEGTIGRRWGHYLLPTNGGAPRYVIPDGTAWWAGGDSLIVAPPPGPDSVFWLRVEDLEGSVGDSIRIARPGLGVYLEVIPGSQWIIALVIRSGALWDYLIVDRRGRIRDQALQRGAWVRGSSDAVWAVLGQPGPDAVANALVRMPFDGRTGRFSGPVDTVYRGTPSGFDVTADGSTLVFAEGTYEYGIWTQGLTEALRGSLPPDRLVLSASSQVAGFISPDGGRLLLLRRQLGPAGAAASRVSLVASSGGPETPVPLSGRVDGVCWVDSLTAALAEQAEGKVKLSLIDVRTGTRRAVLATPDSELSAGTYSAFTPLVSDGWAWIPVDGQRVRTQRPGETSPRDIAVPPWYGGIYSVTDTPDNRGLAYIGFSGTDPDSVRVSVFSFADSSTTAWATVFAPEIAWFSILPDRSILLYAKQHQENLTVYRVPAPSRIERLGTIPRPVQFMSVSDDMRHAVLTVIDYHGDAWMYRVVRP